MRMHWKYDIIMMFPINEQDYFIALLDILCDSDIIAIKRLSDYCLARILINISQTSRENY